MAIQTQAPEAEAFRQQVIDLQTARDTASSSTEPNSNTTDKKKFVKGPATRDIDIPKMWQAPTIGFIQDIPQYQNWNPAPVEPTTPSRPQVQQSAQFGSDVTNVQRNSQTQQSNTGAAVPFATHQGNMAPVYTNMSPASLQHMMMGQGSGAMPFVQGGITGNMGMGNMGNMGMQMGQSVISPPAYGVMGPPPPPGSSSYGNNPSYGGAFREQFDAIQTTPQRSYGNRGGRGGRGRGQARREHGGSMGSGQSWSHSPQVYGYEGRRYSDASSQAQQTPFRGKRRSQQNRGDHSSEESYAGRFSDADLTPRPTGSRHISENDLNPLYQASEVSDKHKRGRSPSRRFSQAETESLAPVNSTSMSAQVPTVHGHPDVEKASSTEMPKIPQPVFESSKMSETTETAKDDLRTFTAYNVTSTVFDTLTADTPSEEQQLPSKEDMSTSDIRKAESDEAPKAVVAKAKSVSPYEPRKYNAQAKDAKTAEKAPEWEVVTSKKPKGTTKAPSKPVETTSEPKDSKLPKQRGNGGNDNRTKAVGRKAKGRSGDNKPSPKKEAEADKTDATLEFAADMNSEMDFPSLGGPSTAQRKVVPDYSGYMSHDPKAEEHTASTWAEALRSQNIRAEAESLRPESQLSHYSDMTDIPAHIVSFLHGIYTE